MYLDGVVGLLIGMIVVLFKFIKLLSSLGMGVGVVGMGVGCFFVGCVMLFMVIGGEVVLLVGLLDEYFVSFFLVKFLFFVFWIVVFKWVMNVFGGLWYMEDKVEMFVSSLLSSDGLSWFELLVITGFLVKMMFLVV